VRSLHRCTDAARTKLNYTIGGEPVIGNAVGERLKIFLKLENGRIRKSFETIPWD
jgi:hypothetical protein